VGRVAIVKNSLTFTIAICSLNGENRLPATLKALFDQIPHGTPVIVIDDGSTDKTSEIAKQYGVTVIRHKVNMGYGYARQSAVEACQTEILAFIDDSCLVSRDWFLTLQKDWQEMHLNIVALAGPMIPTHRGRKKGYLHRNNPFTPIRSLNKKSMTFYNRLSRYIFPMHSLNSGYIESTANGNLSLKVAAIFQIDGYNINLTQGGEDEELCARILKAYGTNAIYFDEDLWVAHSLDTVFNILRRNYRYGHTSASSWLRSGGIPTILPLPVFFVSALLLCAVSTSWAATISFLLAYPIFISKGNFSKKFVHVTSTFIDPYIRLILEIANNFGFITGFIQGVPFLAKINQSEKADKK
jgi:glycosyltransferase involved in cell wall biosynthesis